MEILIAGLGLGLVALIVFFFKFSTEETKSQKISEESKNKKLSDLEAEIARRDLETKKMMEERQKLEDEFLKVKDEVDILKKDNSEMGLKVRQLERAKEEFSQAKAEMKQKDALLEQETIARQKMQGELSLQQRENEKLTKEAQVLRNELKTKTDMFEGLKAQFDELESELQRTREELLKRDTSAQTKEQAPLEKKEPKAPPILFEPSVFKGPEAFKKEPPAPAAPVAAALPEEKQKIELPKIKEEIKVSEPAVPKIETKKMPLPAQELPKKEVAPIQSSETKKELEEIPGFPKQAETKVGIRQGVPQDTDFLKAQPLKKDSEQVSDEIPPGTFKLTNVNKPKSETPDSSTKEIPDKKPPEKDKNKSKKETLIEGFHPHHPPEQQPS